MPFPPSEDLPHPGFKPASPLSPALQADSLPSEAPGKPMPCGKTKKTKQTKKTSIVLNSAGTKPPSGFPGGSDGKESACNVGELGLITGLRRSLEGGHSNPLQYSCLENPMDRGAWRAVVHGVTKQVDTTEYTHGTVQSRDQPSLVDIHSHLIHASESFHRS